MGERLDTIAVSLVVFLSELTARMVQVGSMGNVAVPGPLPGVVHAVWSRAEARTPVPANRFEDLGIWSSPVSLLRMLCWSPWPAFRQPVRPQSARIRTVLVR